jgi:hypothetical protein
MEDGEVEPRIGLPRYDNAWNEPTIGDGIAQHHQYHLSDQMYECECVAKRF